MKPFKNIVGKRENDKSNVAKFMISDSKGVETWWEKGEDAAYQHFLLVPQCFQKVLFPHFGTAW